MIKGKINLLFIIVLVAALVFCCLSGCGSRNKFLFPDDRPIWDERTKNYGNGRLSASNQIQFDFYVQATSYMAGFVAASGPAGNAYTKMLSTSLSIADNMAKEEKFFRFDVKNYDSGNAMEPYSISRAQFEQQAIADKSFYCVQWYFEQEGRQKEQYREYLEKLVEGDPDGIYDNESVTLDGYLLNALKQSYLNKNNVSVIVTDFVDARFDTESVFDWLSGYIMDNPDKAVAIVACKSQFSGKVYTGIKRKAFTYENAERPFYLLILGNISDVENYKNTLDSQAGGDKLGGGAASYQSILLSGRKSNYPTMNYASQSDITMDNVKTAYDEMPLSERRLMRLNEQNSKNILDLSEANVLTLKDSLCYQINTGFENDESVAWEFNIPLYGFSFWKNDTNMKLAIDTELYASYSNDDSSGYAWKKGNDLLSDASQLVSAGSAAAITDDGNNINLNLVIDKSILKRIAPLDKNNSIKIDAKVINTLEYEEPSWLNDYFYGQAYTWISDENMDNFGRYTVSTVSGSFSKLIRAANSSGTNNNIVADILLYLKY